MADPKYGWPHQQERKRWRKLIDQGGVACCFCGVDLEPGQPFDLDHLPGATTLYRGAACPSCNRSDGGRRRHVPHVPRNWEL